MAHGTQILVETVVGAFAIKDSKPETLLVAFAREEIFYLTNDTAAVFTFPTDPTTRSWSIPGT